jgi:hypothetical protein
MTYMQFTGISFGPTPHHQTVKEDFTAAPSFMHNNDISRRSTRNVRVEGQYKESLAQGQPPKEDITFISPAIPG